ncbi:MAG: homocysteine S-methyltransferase family protein [Rhodobacter sp.]|nr:homocysteine S-methyltransferase family protein [Rhodobacter sp.]
MSRYDTLLKRLQNGARIMIDGGTGTEVERRGVPQLENAWNGGGALSHPDIVRGIHEDYIRHGSEIVISNTFATSRSLLEDAGVPELFHDYNRRGVELACEARAAMGRPDVLVAGGISHWSFSGRLPSLEDLETGASEQAKIMAGAGADLIMLEMMVEVPRMLAVLNGAKTSGLPVWVGLSCAPGANGRMCLQGGDTDTEGNVIARDGEFLRDAIEALSGRDVPLLSIMHTDVRHIDACLDIVEEHWNGLVGVYAHSGRFIDGKWVFEGTISPDAYAAASKKWLDRGVQVVGGCCGIRPDHIAELSKVFDGSSVP